MSIIFQFSRAGPGPGQGPGWARAGPGPGPCRPRLAAPSGSPGQGRQPPLQPRPGPAPSPMGHGSPGPGNATTQTTTRPSQDTLQPCRSTPSANYHAKKHDGFRAVCLITKNAHQSNLFINYYLFDFELPEIAISIILVCFGIARLP